MIDYYPKYLLDASVMLAYMDEGEPYHKEALAFFTQIQNFVNEGKIVDLMIPAHFYLECNLNIGKKRNDVADGKNTSYKFRAPKEFNGFKAYSITPNLMKQIEDKGIYEKFENKLRPGDFVYGAIALLDSIPLVTLDKKDFSKIASDVKIIFLNS